MRLDRYVPLATVVAMVGAVALALVLGRAGGFVSRPVDSVPPLLSEPAGVPGAGLVLAADGLGPVTFGDAEADVLAKLTELLGDPVEDSHEPCRANGDDVRWVRWANLTIALEAGHFNGYISGIYFPPDSPEMPIKTAEGVGLRATVDDLASVYGARLAWSAPVTTGFGNPLDGFGIDGFDVVARAPSGVGGYVEGGRQGGQVITFLAGQPCVDNGP